MSIIAWIVLGLAAGLIANMLIPGRRQQGLILTCIIGIVGALLIDANNRPYYVKNNRRYYVTQPEAQYYRSHHHVVQRRAYVPEQEYPVARNPYQGGNNGHR